MAEFLAERKLSPDIVPVDPKIYVDSSGNVSADFSEFEIEAQYYIEELKFPRLYMNGSVNLDGGILPTIILERAPMKEIIPTTMSTATIFPPNLRSGHSNPPGSEWISCALKAGKTVS